MRRRKIIFFTLFGIISGMITGVICLYSYGLQTGVICGLVSGSACGLAGFFILDILHIHAVKKVAHELSGGSYGIHHIRNIELQVPYDRAFDLCIESSAAVKNCRICTQNHSQGLITAKTSINWKTWGDTVTFNLKKINDKHTSITVSSRPTARTTIVDYGKNLENVEKIAAYLKKNLK